MDHPPPEKRKRISTLTPEQRALRARMAGYATAASGNGNTEKARAAFNARFEREVDPDGVLPETERQKRAQAAKQAHMTRLSFLSSKARSKGTPECG